MRFVTAAMARALPPDQLRKRTAGLARQVLGLRDIRKLAGRPGSLLQEGDSADDRVQGGRASAAEFSGQSALTVVCLEIISMKEDLLGTWDP